MIKTYYVLTKPGIVFGNAITATAGFALASQGAFHLRLFLAMLLGLSLIIASACVFNNMIDRDVDEKMVRTRERALVKGSISPQRALQFAILLLFSGVSVLLLFTNLLTLSIALAGFFIYLVLYTLLKYRSTHATLIGSLAGGVPPVVGYCAVSHCLDVGAFLLFLIVVLWQMPHFFAIAMYRLSDYAAASIPVLPVKKGMYVTKIQMLLYILAFIIATVMLTLFGFTGYAYLIVALLLGLPWAWLSIQGFKSKNDMLWARKMFFLSLVIIVLLSFMISIDYR